MITLFTIFVKSKITHLFGYKAVIDLYGAMSNY